jgi:hypothetical protein
LAFEQVIIEREEAVDANGNETETSNEEMTLLG